MAAEHWYLRIVKKGIDPCHEANTSRYVQEVLLECLGWPMEKIHPQVGKRGFIDYKLVFPQSNACVHVEVKKFGAPLKDAHIRKYLVRRGPRTEDLQVGVLTNLSEWWIYVAGSSIRTASGASMVRVKDVAIQRRLDIANLYALIGYRSNGGLKNVRAALGESPAVLRHLMGHDPQILKAVRTRLNDQEDGRIPQYERLKDMILAISDGQGIQYDKFSRSKLLRALRSRLVADMANKRLVSLFGARNRRGKVRAAIKTLLVKYARLSASQRAVA